MHPTLLQPNNPATAGTGPASGLIRSPHQTISGPQADVFLMSDMSSGYQYIQQVWRDRLDIDYVYNFIKVQTEEAVQLARS